eukprot:26001-Pelagomonas_calceolata.AAC.1
MTRPLAQGSSLGFDSSDFMAPSTFSQQDCRHNRWCFNPACTRKHSPEVMADRRAAIANVLHPFKVLPQEGDTDQKRKLAGYFFDELWLAAKPLEVPDPLARTRMREIAETVGRLARDPTALPSLYSSILSDARVLGEEMSKVSNGSSRALYKLAALMPPSTFFSSLMHAWLSINRKGYPDYSTKTQAWDLLELKVQHSNSAQQRHKEAAQQACDPLDKWDFYRCHTGSG